jgi:hypothetical protein
MIKNTTMTLLAASLVLGLIGPTFALAAGPEAVNLGTAGNFVILSKTGISTTGSTLVTGDIGISPAAATYITGFSLTLPATAAFSTSAQVTGKVYAPGYADPTAANLTTAILDMQTAYTDAAGRAPTVTELGAGNIGGLTLAPGVYKWGTGLTIPTDVTLSGSSSDVWIFQVAQTLTVSSAAKIILSGGAQASNIFWVVAGQTTIGTTAAFNGNILDQTAIVLNTGAQLNGRALAQTAVTLDSNSVTIPSGPVMTPPPAPNPEPNPTPAPNPNPSPAPTGSPTLPMVNTPWANGSLVKLADSDTVYLVANGQLKPFTSAAIFFAKGLKFTDVQTVSNSQLASVSMDAPVLYPDGSLIKGSDATVYIVTNGQKSGIPSLAVFQRLGLSFNNLALLNDMELASYPDGVMQQ